MNRGMRILGILVALSLAGSARAARLHFGQTNYTVTAGGTFQAQVYLDMNEAAAGDQMPATGLFSMGVKVILDPLKATVQSTNSIAMPAAIDSDGLGGPGIRAVGQGYAQAAGVVPGAAGYTNALLATVTIKDVSPGTYQLNLGFYHSAPPWDNFLDMLGNRLDGQINNFVPATVQVQVPGAPGATGGNSQ